MTAILMSVAAMLAGKALVTPYEKCRDYERTRTADTSTLLDIGIEANQTTRTLNDILSEERWKKIMAKGEAVEDELEVDQQAPGTLQRALDRLRDDITVLRTARGVDEAEVAMERLLGSSRHALQVQQRSGPPKHETARLIENLNDAFEDLFNTDSNRDRKRAVKYLGGVIQDVEGALCDLGIGN
ncbi:hypothetical protein TruAng_012341 [Truncatella angustata]|nr:hypothetical protein TruAng_012341 [Truncatella angustata]